MPARKQTKALPTLAELFAWVDDFHARSEHFDDATPARVWDLLLRAHGLRTVLHGDTASSEFRKLATPNLRRFVRELKEWDANAQTVMKTGGRAV